MKYSDTTNKNGVIQVYERKTDLGYGTVSGDATKLAEATAVANEKSHEIQHLIHQATGNWQYDDNNQTDLPRAITDLASGTSLYSLPDGALTIQRIEVKDINGNWNVLKPITKEEISSGLDEYLSVDGTPEKFLLVGNTIEVFPASNYNSTGGLMVYYDRGSVDFATSDTTKECGFDSQYHILLPIKMSIEWLSTKQPNSQTLTLRLQEEVKIEKQIREHYGNRFKAKNPILGRKIESFI